MIRRRLYKSAFKKQRNLFNKEHLPLYMKGLPKRLLSFPLPFLFWKVTCILPDKRDYRFPCPWPVQGLQAVGTTQTDVSRKNSEGVG